MKKYLFCLIAAMVFMGCSNEDGKISGAERSSHFITHFVVVDNIECSIGNNPFVAPVVYIRCGGKILHDGQYGNGFTLLQEMYGDTSFTGSTVPFSNGAYAYPIDKISVITDNDFDAEHPAGTAIDDIVKLKFASYEPFISNGYQYPEVDESAVLGGGLVSMGEFFLTEINREMSKLISAKKSPSLKFMKEPDVAGMYSFSLQITFNGETLETRFELTFGNTVDEE